MKKLFLWFVFFAFQACVYAPSQAWKPHQAVLSKKKYKNTKPPEGNSSTKKIEKK